MTPDELRVRRATLDITQQQLAVYLGVDRKTVNRWEKEQTPIPAWLTLALARLQQLAEYGKSVSE